LSVAVFTVEQEQLCAAGTAFILLLLVCRLLVIFPDSLFGLRLPAKDLNKVVGRNVRRLRSELKLSQDEFADRAGLHRTYIGAVERGERNITLNTLAQLALALKVPAGSLMEETTDGD
jgi:DNA-binding XRE family transcriptional regulator